MIHRAVARRYAKALFNTDHEKEHLEQSLRTFDFILQLIHGNPKLTYFLKSPQISLEEKKAVLNEHVKDKTDPTFFRFLSYLLEKRRWGDLTQIASEYRHMVNEHLGNWEAKMIVAVPMGQDVEKRLKDKLENFYGKKIEIKTEIEPKIIGGAILIVANEMIDWSIESRLKKFKDALL